MSLKFDALQLDPAILRALQSAGYDSPTPVQAQAVPAALAGRDLMASAQTGSGKTAAFLLPALQKMIRRSDKPGKGPRVLVLTPTRELAMQVEKNAQLYAQNMKWLRSATLVGGAGFGFQIKALSRPIDLIVATPGRLMDHMRAGRIDFDRLEMLVLDEADRMLDMGFIDDIKTIVAATPDSRQTLLFSATWDGEVGKLARNLTKNPEVIEIERVDEQGKIEEQLLYCDDKNHKNRLLDHILRDANIDQCVIFTATKAMSEQLADELYEKGFAANCLHGDMPQGWRNRTLNDLRQNPRRHRRCRPRHRRAHHHPRHQLRPAQTGRRLRPPHRPHRPRRPHRHRHQLCRRPRIHAGAQNRALSRPQTARNCHPRHGTHSQTQQSRPEQAQRQRRLGQRRLCPRQQRLRPRRQTPQRQTRLRRPRRQPQNARGQTRAPQPRLNPQAACVA